MPGDLLSDSGSGFSDNSDTDSSWEDDFVYEDADEATEEEQHPQEREELTSARRPDAAPYAAASTARKSPAKPSSTTSTTSPRPGTATATKPPSTTYSFVSPRPTTAGAAEGSRPPTAGTSRPSTARSSVGETAAGPKLSPRPQTQEQKKTEQASDASMAHLAELYSKQGKDLYSSGTYVRYLHYRY